MTPATRSTVVPVFPLPNSVLFPHTVLPLHVFEPRYRAMVRDVVRGDRSIAIALLCPGWEQEDTPSFHPVGTVGRISGIEELADGRFLLNLAGRERVRFTELPTDKPYRLVMAEALPERYVDETSQDLRRDKLALLSSYGYLMHELQNESTTPLVLDESASFATAVNTACARMPIEPGIRQELLEIDDLLARYRRATTLLQSVLEAVLRLKARPGTPIN